MVLKIHVVRPGGHLYYVNELIPGRAEGSLVAGESPGVWSGDGAAGLGMTGTVEAQGFGEVLDGRDPWSGRTIRESRGHHSVSGYDLSFCAPKSVSLLHLLAPREIAGHVGAGHRAAVAEAMDYLQRTGLGVRRSHRGVTSFLPTTGAVAGEFVHRTSRALDPHLHSHLVVANVAQGVDGRWSAVDSRRIFSHAQATQGIYHARLRMELTERLGAAWEVRPSGLGDVVGVDVNLRRLFSRRTAAIGEYMTVRAGGRGAPSRRGAFHATRPEKDRSQTVESLTGEWRQRADDFGIDLGDLTRVVGLGRTVRSTEVVDADRVARRLGQLERTQSTVARRDLVAAVADASPGGATVQVIESVTAQVVEVAGAPLDRAGMARHHRRDGRAPSRGAREPRWSAGDVARAVEREPRALSAVVGSPPMPGEVVPRSPELALHHVHPDLAREGDVTRAVPTDPVLVRGDVWER